jgi:hypothetical protein
MDSVPLCWFASRLPMCSKVYKYTRPTLWISSRRIASTSPVHWLQCVISNAGFVHLQHRAKIITLYFNSVDKGAEPFSLAIQSFVCLSLGLNHGLVRSVHVRRSSRKKPLRYSLPRRHTVNFLVVGGGGGVWGKIKGSGCLDLVWDGETI